MKMFEKSLLVTDLVRGLKGNLSLVENVVLDNAADLLESQTSSLCFYENPKYLHLLADIKVGLLIAPKKIQTDKLPNINIFFTDSPYLTFNLAVFNWMQSEKKDIAHFIDSSASLGKSSSLGKSITLKKNVVIGENVNIGANTIIESNVVVSDNVTIGNNCHIFPNSTIYSETLIKDRVIIHSGTIIGSDGFGYILSDDKQNKIHHIGKVIIENDVEIGANTCIDRGTLGVTKIGEGTKIDNLVQVGHNCKIGRHSILCAQVGLSGNTEIGDYVYLGGQVGSAGHLKIDDQAMIGAQSGISGDIPKGKKYIGTPALEAGLQKRIIVSLKQLPDILKFIQKLKRKDKTYSD